MPAGAVEKGLEVVGSALARAKGAQFVEDWARFRWLLLVELTYELADVNAVQSEVCHATSPIELGGDVAQEDLVVLKAVNLDCPGRDQGMIFHAISV
jgi:hypothetical protein